MHLHDDKLLFFATDLSNFLACPHLSALDRQAALGLIDQPTQFQDDPGLKALRERGQLHERQFLEKLRVTRPHVIEITKPSPQLTHAERWRQMTSQTLAAMKTGADVVYQGALTDGTWAGYTDFLIKVDKPSDLGGWSYEVTDTKLAREAKGGALLQVLLYADLLAKAQGVESDYVHLALGGPDEEYKSFRVADYAAYFRSVRRRFTEAANGRGSERVILPSAVDPVAHCDMCAWGYRCDEERHNADHLSVIAGISSSQRRTLVERGITTLEMFAEAALPFTPKLDLNAATLERIHGQALIQLKGRRTNAPTHELLQPIVPEQGLAALPAPSAGDLFFDLEGDPFAHTYGIEYLFGYTDAAGEYFIEWALTPAEEKRAFEQFIDFVMARLERFPDLHIYHYAPYEPSALKRLMGRYGTREDEVDRLLRGKVFVDLYRVVRQGLRASVESYSIKKLEPFYGYVRDVDLRVLGSDKANFECWLEIGGERSDVAELQASIEGYNRDDCVSTLRLRDWLEKLRDELVAFGTEVPRPASADPAPDEELAKHQAEVAVVVEQLMHGLSVDPSPGTPEHARWLLAHLLEFHRREKKSYWWDFFRRLELVGDELLEDRKTLGGLRLVGEVPDPNWTSRSKSKIFRYTFPPQEQSFSEDKKTKRIPDEKNAGTVVAINDAEGWIELKRANCDDHPENIMLDDFVDEKAMRESLLRFGRVYAAGRAEAQFASAADLLHSNPGNILAYQGPPGAGKTHTGANLILDHLAAGKRVGVTANSHKVIGNLLAKVCSEGKKRGFEVKGIQKAEGDDWCACPEITCADDNKDVLAALQSGEMQLAAGTAWMWSREDFEQSVDYLFIDEAGQFSLANGIAVAPAAAKLVMLGDPQQLDQPLQGVHPPGVAVSALGHILGEHATMPEDKGVFLKETWRLHPALTAFTSEVFYEGRLSSREMVRDCGVTPGLRYVPVRHVGNTSESIEEVDAVANLVAEFMRQGITLEDIVIVAPYNMQVSAIARKIPGARVGTVDKFQGQEAPIAIYSMATSTALDAPRGMKFLYSPNRFNVATSRAKCLAIVVASPELFVPDCRTPEQMKLANAFCRFAELASHF